MKNKTLSNGYKKRILEHYSVFCEQNQIPFDKPKMEYEAPIPLIPSKENVNLIINTASTKYTAIFTTLSQTAIEPEELHRIKGTMIDKEEGKLTVTGTKGHNNGSYKLKSETAEMLRIYLSKTTNKEQPFPEAKAQGEAWRQARRKIAKKLCKPELDLINLKNLRNYAGEQFYKHEGKHDPIATMRFMRHKQLETTLGYIRSINLDEPEEYKTEAVKLGEPNTGKRIIELSDAGYQKITEADGYQYFRIRK